MRMLIADSKKLGQRLVEWWDSHTLSRSWWRAGLTLLHRSSDRPIDVLVRHRGTPLSDTFTRYADRHCVMPLALMHVPPDRVGAHKRRAHGWWI